MRIAFVGNASLSRDFGAEIDRSDIVIRFNLCRNYAAGGGVKADVLALSNTGKTGRRFGRLSTLRRIPCLTPVKQVWLTRNRAIYDARKAAAFFLDRGRRIANTDYAPRIVKKLGPREIVIFGADIQTALDDKLRKFGAAAGTMPSVGMLAIEYVLDKMASGATEIVLYGFTHQGIAEHAWDSERRLVDSYIEAGLIARVEV